MKVEVTEVAPCRKKIAVEIPVDKVDAAFDEAYKELGNGVQLKGFPSLILSTTKLDHSRGLGGVVLNVRFQADVLDEQNGLEGLKGLLEAAFDLGAYQMQFNLASTEVLRAAQERPDEYADLFVRIGGYLVPFTLLPPKAQEEVIARTELGL